MRNANLTFERKGNKALFLRGRIQDKGARWVDKFQVGKLELESGKEYPIGEMVELTANGIRVTFEPPQPKVERVVNDPVWSKVSMKAIEEEKSGKRGRPAAKGTESPKA